MLENMRNLAKKVLLGQKILQFAGRGSPSVQLDTLAKLLASPLIIVY
jgi:hypothetical protein